MDMLWRAWARRYTHKMRRRYLWDIVEPYERPRSLVPLLAVNIAAFYTGVIGAAVNEQLYKERFWEEHPGEAVPIRKPLFYFGKYKVTREELSGGEGSK